MSDEAVVREHFKKIGWGEPNAVVSFTVPKLYRGDFSDGAGYVVVRDGKVVEEQGVEALGRHMKAVDLAAAPGVTAEDLLRLIELLKAYPPVESPDHYQNKRTTLTELNPRLERKDGTITLVLSYLFPPPRGAVAQPNKRGVWQFTLTASRPDYKPTWTESEIEVDLGAPK
jgi:hypothetical protein